MSPIRVMISWEVPRMESLRRQVSRDVLERVAGIGGTCDQHRAGQEPECEFDYKVGLDHRFGLRLRKVG